MQTSSLEQRTARVEAVVIEVFELSSTVWKRQITSISIKKLPLIEKHAQGERAVHFAVSVLVIFTVIIAPSMVEWKWRAIRGSCRFDRIHHVQLAEEFRRSICVFLAKQVEGCPADNKAIARNIHETVQPIAL